MEIRKLNIQQMDFDGLQYTKGIAVDLLDKFNIGCEEFPFKKYPEAKELPKRDWPGEDGVESFVPKKIPMKAYDIEVTFIYKGTEATMQKDIDDFIMFLYGRNEGATGSILAIYDEHVKIGRKDVRCQKVHNELYYDEEYDDEKIAKFKVIFSVDDPITEVTPKYTIREGAKVISDLEFDTTN